MALQLWHDKEVGNYDRENTERYQSENIDKFGNYLNRKVQLIEKVDVSTFLFNI